MECNVCEKKLSGVVFRTTCRHLFCNNCASKYFLANSICPLPSCQINLVPGDVSEIVLGCSSQSNNNMVDNSLMTVFQDEDGGDWNDIMKRTKDIHDTIAETQNILITQSLLQIDRKINEMNLWKDRIREREQKVKEHVIGLQNSVDEEVKKRQGIEEDLTAREIQLEEARNQLNESTRRCFAWEKAYNALRDQFKIESSRQNHQSSPSSSLTSSPPFESQPLPQLIIQQSQYHHQNFEQQQQQQQQQHQQNEHLYRRLKPRHSQQHQQYHQSFQNSYDTPPAPASAPIPAPVPGVKRSSFFMNQDYEGDEN
jgi:hypothetical protein